MTDWPKSWLGNSTASAPAKPRDALLAAQAAWGGAVAGGQRRDLGEELFEQLAGKIPPLLHGLFGSGRAVIGEINVPSPAAFANILPSGGYWVEVYSGLGPFFEAAAHAMYSSMHSVNADGSLIQSGIGIGQSDTELVKLLRAYAENGQVPARSTALPIHQSELAGRLARAAQVFVVAHELGHLIKWETEKSAELTSQGEIAADKLGLAMSLGLLRHAAAPLSADDITDSYAGAEFALRLFSALEAIGFDFQADSLHPYPKDRLEILRSQAQGILGTAFDFIFVSRRAFSHDLILQRMEDSVAGRPLEAGLAIKSPIQGVATLSSWIAMAATVDREPEYAAREFEAIYGRTAGEMRESIAKGFARTYTEEPIQGGDSVVSVWRREQQALAAVLSFIEVGCRKWMEDALAKALKERPASGDAGARRYNKLNWKYTAGFLNEASVIAGTPAGYSPTQNAINVLVRPDAPEWVEGTPAVSEETKGADGLVQIPSQFRFYAMLEEHDGGCACGCNGDPVLWFMLQDEQPAVMRKLDERDMIWSAAAGDEDDVLEFLDDGVAIESKFEGATALILASQHGQVRMVELLLDHGAKVDNAMADGRSAISFAADQGHVDIVRLLLERGASMNLCDDEGKTPLMYAAMSGHFTSVEVLLQHGASSEVCSNSGWTALMYARGANATEVVKRLEAGAPKH